MSFQQHRPPRVGFGRHPAGQRWTALRGGHRVTVTQADVAHLTSPWPGSPTAPVTGPDMRPHSAVVTVSRSRRLILLISHLRRRVPPPPRAWWDILSLHQKGVGGER